MKCRNYKLLIPVLFLLSMLSISSCNISWSVEEQKIIEQASYSRMRVLTIDNPSDSISLREKSRKLSKRAISSPLFGALVSSMIETVNDPNDPGVGIAAPQVGVNVKLVAVQRFDKEGTPFEIFVNPQIVSYGKNLISGREGCLSVPDYSAEVLRSDSIEIVYNHPITFEEVRESVAGFTAIIFQHEIDHLDGILYVDRLEKSPSNTK